jgi:hypothetical protein
VNNVQYEQESVRVIDGGGGGWGRLTLIQPGSGSIVNN